MRFFIALEIPEHARQHLKIVQDQLEKILPSARLTNSEKLHLTLVFIGEQPDSLKSTLVQIINQAVLGIAPFQVTPSFIDGFPTIHKPHTLWIGVSGAVDKLHLIRERIRDGLQRIEFPTDERRFVPHIAIAKFKSILVTPDQEAILQTLVPPLDPIIVSSIRLFESVPEGVFHRHNTLADIKLKS